MTFDSQSMSGSPNLVEVLRRVQRETVREAEQLNAAAESSSWFLTELGKQRAVFNTRIHFYQELVKDLKEAAKQSIQKGGGS